MDAPEPMSPDELRRLFTASRDSREKVLLDRPLFRRLVDELLRLNDRVTDLEGSVAGFQTRARIAEDRLQSLRRMFKDALVYIRGQGECPSA